MLNWNTILTKTAEHYRKYPHKAGYRKDECSKEAARRIDGTLNERQELVYKALQTYPNGATSEQIALFLHKPALSIKPRMTELLLMGKIRKSGRKSKTEMGGVCHIWEIV